MSTLKEDENQPSRCWLTPGQPAHGKVRQTTIVDLTQILWQCAYFENLRKPWERGQRRKKGGRSKAARRATTRGKFSESQQLYMARLSISQCSNGWHILGREKWQHKYNEEMSGKWVRPVQVRENRAGDKSIMKVPERLQPSLAHISINHDQCQLTTRKEGLCPYKSRNGHPGFSDGHPNGQNPVEAIPQWESTENPGNGVK